MVRGADTHDLADAIRAAGCRPTTLKLRDGRVVGSRFTLPGHGLIEVALPRTERSTGPGHRDFEIITTRTCPLGRRRAPRLHDQRALPGRAHAGGARSAR
jgi:hypothetical protein